MLILIQTSGVYYDNTHIAFRAERVGPPSSGCLPRMYRESRQFHFAFQEMAHQKEILPDIIAFNDALREALRDMYDRAHRIWDKTIQIIDENDGEEMELEAKCYFDYTYPELHPIQGKDRQDLWDALCDIDLNPMYGDGISVLTLTFPRDEDGSFNSFIGMDCPPPNWNEGLDQELTKDLHLISQFHNLFQHMNFALTDFLYVRKFKTEINIEIIQ